MEFKNVYEKLSYIQKELRAPKNQRNSFGGYNYRSCEDILESVKHLLEETKTVLILNDELVNIGERYYVKANAILIDIEKENSAVSNSAYAREEESKKGMDGSQITGASSSYARKYALNGLLAIDDVKDSDATNKHGKDEVKTKCSEKLVKELKELGGTLEIVAAHFGCKIEDLEDKQLQYLIDLKKEKIKNAQLKANGEVDV